MNGVLVTGAAGFIGAAVSQALLDQGHRVYGIDSLNDYYDIRLKMHRLDGLRRILDSSLMPLTSRSQRIRIVIWNDIKLMWSII